MALADYLTKGSHLEKFAFDVTKVNTQKKMKELSVGDEFVVKAIFYGVDKSGRAYATIYTDNFYFFVPTALVTKVTGMCKDAEVRQAINSGNLIVNIYEYENTFGKFKSVGFIAK